MKLMRILSGILASVIATGCLLYSAPPKGIPAPALNAYADSLGDVDFGDPTFTVDNLTFTVYDDSATLTKCSTNATGAIEIPAECEGKPVTMITANAFQRCSQITSISMPDSINTIGEYAFDSATSLQEISISKSIRSISDYCFQDCKSLKSLTIPDTVSRINNGAFGRCTALSSITIPESVQSLGAGVFSGCTLKKLTILNPNMSISSSLNGLTVQTISGYAGSTAENYAKTNGIAFIALEGTPTTTTATATTTMPRTTTTTRMAVTTWMTTTTRMATTTKIVTTKSANILQDGLKKFDINKDNRVTIADAVLLTRFVSEDEAAVLPRNSEPDVDADGLVTIEDVMSVLRALQPFSIQIGKATAKPGEKVTVPIKIYADKGTAAGQLYVGCDSKLTPVSVKSGDAYTMNFYADCEAYPITITWTAKGGKDQIAKNGAVLAELEFEVDPNIKSLEYLEISIMPQAGSYTTSFSDSSDITYTAGYRSGYITVIP